MEASPGQIVCLQLLDDNILEVEEQNEDNASYIHIWPELHHLQGTTLALPNYRLHVDACLDSG